MDEHISLEDLVKFIWMDSLDPENMELSMKVNCHLIQCEECARRAEQLQKMHEDTCALRRRRGAITETNRRMKKINNELLPVYRGKLLGSGREKKD